jgi:hypothetical protein
VTIVRGNNQTGSAGATLPESLGVLVTDSIDRPVVGVRVAFTPLTGGSVHPDTARTDGEGRAATQWTLARAGGPQRVRARAVSGDSAAQLEVTFQASAQSTNGGKLTTVTTIQSHTPDPSNQGRGVIITVNVTSPDDGSTPPGDFTVTASTGETCAGVTDEGRAECIFNSPGPRDLIASYGGDDRYAPSTSDPVTQTVNAVAGATRTIIGIGPDPGHVGQSIQAFAHVRGAGGVPAFGMVNFYEGKNSQCGQGRLLGGIELNGSGDGVLPVKFSAPGVYVIRGCYVGAPGFAPSEDLAVETIVQ